MKMKLNKLILTISIGSALIAGGCKKYLDVNRDPASPQTPDLGSLFAPVTGTM
jgi:hypothetical protein